MKKNVIIEIAKGSNIKYEIENGKIMVDRILYGASVYPLNYGYFENTLDWDGDALDALVLADQEFIPTSSVPVRVIGAMKMIDGGETDTKLITVIDVDPRYKHVESMNDVPSFILDNIRDFFENYKNLQNKQVKILGFEGAEYAQKEFAECEELYAKYSDMDKKDFVAKMKKEHPGKYE